MFDLHVHREVGLRRGKKHHQDEMHTGMLKITQTIENLIYILIQRH